MVVACLGGSVVAWGATIYVPDSYTCVQNAINAAVNGDEVVIRPGCYNGSIDFCGKAITVRSLNPNDPAIVSSTILDGGWSHFGAGTKGDDWCEPVVTFKHGEGSDSKLLGLTITNGHAKVGSGILCDGASPTIQFNNILNNGIDFSSFVWQSGKKSVSDATCIGGGIAVLNGSPLIDSNDIELNFAEIGGGIFVTGASARPTINANTITANFAECEGGGLYADLGAVVSVTNNLFGTAPTGAICAQATALKAKANVIRNAKTATGPAPASKNKKNAVAAKRTHSKVAGTPKISPKALRQAIYSGNAAEYGGAIYLQSCAANLNSNKFVSNAATYEGGAIWGNEACLVSISDIFDRNYTNDLLDDTGYGGAVALYYGQASFTEDKFTYNCSGEGGAMYFESGTVIAKDCAFAYNVCDTYGGAVEAYTDDSDYNFTGNFSCCTFDNNSAEYGGAVYAEASNTFPWAPLDLTDCTFTDNTVETEGGAVYLYDGVATHITKCTFDSNMAPDYGSAIYNEDALFALVDSTLVNNVGPYYNYGTVYTEGTPGPTIVAPPPAPVKSAKDFDENTITGCTFTRNTTYEGGGVYVDSGDTQIEKNLFQENTVIDAGGAIYWDSTDEGEIECNTFLGNSATTGGAIAVYFAPTDEDDLKVSGNFFTGNMSGSSSGEGGAMYINADMVVDHNTFFQNSSGFKGGAIFIDNVPADVINNTFSDNWALRGGTIYECATAIAPPSPSPSKQTTPGLDKTLIENNIIAFTKRGWGLLFEGCVPCVKFNDFFGNVPCDFGGGFLVSNPTAKSDGGDDHHDCNIFADPLFVDRANGILTVKSVEGHYDFATMTFVRDLCTSRTIDAGDPCADFSCEPQPNGFRINQGAQGGTEFASKSSMFAQVCFTQGQNGVSRSGPMKFVFLTNMTKDSVTAHMNVVPGGFPELSPAASSKQVTSGITWLCLNKMIFTPTPPLNADSDYAIVFTAGIKRLDHSCVPYTEVFNFHTGVEPVVLSATPSDGCTGIGSDAKVTVQFDQPMKTAVTQLCFSVVPRVPGTFAWNTAKTQFTWTPVRPLTLGTSYTIAIGAASRSAKGISMLRECDWCFQCGSSVGAPAALAVTAVAAPTAAGAQITVNLASAATVGASIRNVAGVEVANIAAQDMASGVNTLLWDGKSKLGTIAPAGRYLIQISAAKADGTQANCLTTLMR